MDGSLIARHPIRELAAFLTREMAALAYRPRRRQTLETKGSMRNYTKLLLIVFGVAIAAAIYAMSPPGALPAVAADKVVVLKSEHKLILLRNGTVLKTYKVSIGRNPIGAKMRAGDHRTPEGSYVVDWRNPKSKFHLSLHFSYPNARDIENARREGLQPGGDIMIHGIQNGLGWIGRFHRFVDWTDGCIAVTDAEMDQIWHAVPDGTSVEIRR
jgi:murein L,D-transpeptidase YafK